MANLRLDNGTRIVLYRMSKRARRLQTDEVLEMLNDNTLDMQCSDDSGDDELMMVGSDDEFSDLEMEGTTPLIVILFIMASTVTSLDRNAAVHP